MAGPPRGSRPRGTEHSDGEGRAATLKHGPPAGSITDRTPHLPLKAHAARSAPTSFASSAVQPTSMHATDSHRAPFTGHVTACSRQITARSYGGRGGGAVSAAAATCRASTPARSPAVQSLVEWAVSLSPQRTHLSTCRRPGGCIRKHRALPAWYAPYTRPQRQRRTCSTARSSRKSPGSGSRAAATHAAHGSRWPKHRAHCPPLAGVAAVASPGLPDRA